MGGHGGAVRRGAPPAGSRPPRAAGPGGARAVTAALRRWLKRPSRVPRVVRATLALVLGALALTGFAVPASQGQSSGSASAPGGQPPGQPNAPAKVPEAPGPGDPTTSFPSSPQLV